MSIFNCFKSFSFNAKSPTSLRSSNYNPASSDFSISISTVFEETNKQNQTNKVNSDKSLQYKYENPNSGLIEIAVHQIGLNGISGTRDWTI